MTADSQQAGHAPVGGQARGGGEGARFSVTLRVTTGQWDMAVLQGGGRQETKASEWRHIQEIETFKRSFRRGHGRRRPSSQPHRKKRSRVAKQLRKSRRERPKSPKKEKEKSKQ